MRFLPTYLCRHRSLAAGKCSKHSCVLLLSIYYFLKFSTFWFCFMQVVYGLFWFLKKKKPLDILTRGSPYVVLYGTIKISEIRSAAIFFFFLLQTNTFVFGLNNVVYRFSRTQRFVDINLTVLYPAPPLPIIYLCDGWWLARWYGIRMYRFVGFFTEVFLGKNVGTSGNNSGKQRGSNVLKQEDVNQEKGRKQNNWRGRLCPFAPLVPYTFLMDRKGLRGSHRTTVFFLMVRWSSV